jgi:hypothetical protein
VSATYNFEAVNARGVTVATFGDLDLARRWVRDHHYEHDGLRVECVTVTTRREVVYRPRGVLRLVSA